MEQNEFFLEKTDNTKNVIYFNTDYQKLQDFISSKELQYKDFYIIINLLFFSCFIDKIPKLKNENFNRLKYYFQRTFSSLEEINIDITGIENTKNFYLKIVDNIYYSMANKNKEFLTKSLTSILIVFFTYKTVLKLYSKKYIFFEKVENKIDKIIKANIFNLSQYIKKNKKSFNIYEYIDFIKEIINKNEYLLYLTNRQNLRKYKNYFNEFGPDINSLYFIDNKENLLYIIYNYPKESNNIFYRDLLISFIKNLNDLFI